MGEAKQHNFCATARVKKYFCFRKIMFVITETPLTLAAPVPLDDAIKAGLDAIEHEASGFQFSFSVRPLAVLILKSERHILVWLVGKQEERTSLRQLMALDTRFGVQFEEQVLLDKDMVCFGSVSIEAPDAPDFLASIFHVIGVSGNDLCSYHVYDHPVEPT